MDRPTKQLVRSRLTRSRFLRTMLYPEMILYRKYLKWQYAKSADSSYIASLHNKYEGKRCFIIGNGPSLTSKDLDKIKDEYSFASNRIYYIFNMTQWRPTYYVSIDNNVIAAEIDNIKRYGDYPKLINYKAKKYGRKKEENIHYIFFNNGKYSIDPWASEREVTSLHDDLPEYVTRVASVTVVAVELAIYMGFKEIYLLGVDNSYALTADAKGKISVDPTVKSDHFAGMKGATSTSGRSTSIDNVEESDHAYKLAKKFAEAHGVKIYNATRGGKLEVYERVDFDELMG